jgi:hypothetical protein
LLRTAQVERSVQIVQRYQKRFGTNVPIILTGDFNSTVDWGPEFASLWRSNHFEDPFNLLPKVPPLSDRVTHTFHPRKGPRELGQIDAVLVSPSLQKIVLDAKVARYKNAAGQTLPLPKTFEEREKQPSDHFMTFVTLSFQPLVKGAP